MDIQQVEEWLHLATLAPSIYNTQPWRFVVDGPAISLLRDDEHVLPEADPEGRELAISCGAALFNLRVAIAAAGVPASLTLLPDGPHARCLARVDANSGDVEPGLAAFAPAIPQRRSAHGPLEQRPLPPALPARLEDAAAAMGAGLAWVEKGTPRQHLAGLVAEADRLQFANPRWRREHAAWMHPARAADGLPVQRFTGRAVRFVVGHFDVGRTSAGRDEVFALHAPAVAILETPGDDIADWLAAGQALEAVLLAAAPEGISAGFLNQPCQLEDLRPRLQALGGSAGVPQLCIRLGSPVDAPPPRRRRPLAEAIGRPAE